MDPLRRRLADRRGRPRFEIVGEVWGRLDCIVALPLTNVSHGGALVHSDVPLSVDSEHHVTITCDGIPAPTKVRIRRVDPLAPKSGRPRYVIGLEFVSIGAALRAQIDSWLGAEGGAEG